MNDVCPNCNKGHPELMTTRSDGGFTKVYKVKCNNCNLCTSNQIAPSYAWAEWRLLTSKVSPSDILKKAGFSSEDNPYTDFAKEMSLLHEALKAEGFKDAVVDILAKMTPIVWDKVETRKRHERIEKNLEKLNGVVYKSPGWLETIPKEVSGE